MQAEQHFVSDPPASAPLRWREAFPLGQMHTAGDIRQSASWPDPAVVWLSTEDPQWLQHLKDIKALRPTGAVVLLSATPAVDEGLRALDAGVQGYTHAYALPELLQEVALVVQHGGLWVGPELMTRLISATAKAVSSRASATLPAQANPWSMLSAREAQVARLVCAGQSNKEVALKLFISERTVKAHLGQMFEKLTVRDRLQLVLRLASVPEPTTPQPANTAAP